MGPVPGRIRERSIREGKKDMKKAVDYAGIRGFNYTQPGVPDMQELRNKQEKIWEFVRHFCRTGICSEAAIWWRLS